MAYISGDVAGVPVDGVSLKVLDFAQRLLNYCGSNLDEYAK
jgi:hypothetical protein